MIFIAADHNGLQMKNELASWLTEEGWSVEDLGPDEFEKTDDYPDYGIKVAERVAEDPDTHRGIVLCASGVGMSVVADKVRNIRAALIHDPEIARAAQRDDNINVLALGTEYITLDKAKRVITAWLTTPFSGKERHRRRIGKIATYEDNHSCACGAQAEDS